MTRLLFVYFTLSLERKMTDSTFKKIKSLTLENFKAFCHKGSELPIRPIDFEGKNVLIYGENGSGKSSLARALGLYLGVPVENAVNLNAKKITGIEDYSVGIEFNDDSKNFNKETKLSVSNFGAFIDYKSIYDFLHGSVNSHRKSIGTLLNTSGDSQSIFALLILISFAKDESTKIKLDSLKKELENDIKKLDKLKKFKSSLTAETLKEYLEPLNNSFKKLKIEDKINENLLKFDSNLSISNLECSFTENVLRSPKNISLKTQIVLNFDVKINGHVVKFFKNGVTILNEARLSAITLAFYFALIKMRIGNSGLLILDDALVSLDMSNRIPVAEILNAHFQDYQIFFMTHDKALYYYLQKHEFNDNKKWKKFEMYSAENEQGITIPKIYDGRNHLERAEDHFKNHDYPAAANYLRKAIEEKVQEALPNPNSRTDKLSTKFDELIEKHRVLWIAYGNQEDNEKLPKLSERLSKEKILSNKDLDKLCKDFELYKDRIFNPQSHHNTFITKPLFRLELEHSMKFVENFIHDSYSEKEFCFKEEFSYKENVLYLISTHFKIAQKNEYSLYPNAKNVKLKEIKINDKTEKIPMEYHSVFKVSNSVDSDYTAYFHYERFGFYFKPNEFVLYPFLETKVFYIDALDSNTQQPETPYRRYYSTQEFTQQDGMVTHLKGKTEVEVKEDWWLNLEHTVKNSNKKESLKELFEQILQQLTEDINKKIMYRNVILGKMGKLEYKQTKVTLTEDCLLYIDFPFIEDHHALDFSFKSPKIRLDQGSKEPFSLEEVGGKINDSTVDWKKDFKTKDGKSLEDLKNKILEE